jgi:hypothetical protein
MDSNTVFIFVKPGKCFGYAGLQISKVSIGRCGPRDNDKVVLQWPDCQLFPEYFPQATFNPVPDCCTPGLSADSKTEPAIKQPIGQSINNKKF